MQWNILRLRKLSKKTQKEMAKILGIHFTSYSRKERGKVVFTAEELFSLSQYYGVKIDDIFLHKDCTNNAKTKQGVN